MIDQCRQLLSPLLDDDNVSLYSSPGTTPTPTQGPCKRSKTGMTRARGQYCRPSANVLPDDVFLEIFAFCLCDYGEESSPRMRMRDWQRLVHVCQRWRQIIYASPRYLDLCLCCSDMCGEKMPIRKDLKLLSCWPAFPIALSYGIYGGDEDDAIALLKHTDRIHLVNLVMMNPGPHWGNLIAAMQEPFPALTHLELAGPADEPILHGGFLGRSAPCLQQIILDSIPFPELPTLLLSARDLVSLQLTYIPPTGYIAPEAMVASLSVLTKLKTLCIRYFPRISHPEQWRRRPDPQVRAVLPALTDFEFGGCSEYLEDFVAQFDAPQLNGIRTDFNQLGFLRVPRLFQFIGRTENLGLRRAQVKFERGIVKIELRVQVDPDQPELGYGEHERRPHFDLSFPFHWSGTYVAHVAHILSQIFTICSTVDYLCIYATDDHPGWRDYIDNIEWLAFFRLFTTVETLHIHWRLARQVARALEDIPAELVTELLPSLRVLMFEDSDGSVSTEQFVSLRQLYGRPVIVRDRLRRMHHDFVEEL